MPANRNHRPSRFRRLGPSLAALALAAGLAGQAHAQVRPVEIPAGSLDQALMALAHQTGQQLLYTPDLVAGRRTPGLRGRYAPEDAVARLLRDPQVVVTRVGPNALVIKRRGAGDARPFAVEAAGPVAAAEPHTVEELRVTGTHIRGAAAAEAPLLVIDRSALERTGQATLAAALNDLPQVFGGRSTEATVAMGVDRTNSNGGFATGVNLRGLGTDATLVLVNGRRLAGAGSKGEFADVSSIPAIAVERVEVLLDGASALYGSDAVGGVVNIILRQDLDGGELRVRAGQATAGEPREGLVGGVFGRRWSGGGALVSVEAYRREALAAADRAWTSDADLRPRGGSDWRTTFSAPGNILRQDPVTRVASPWWGVPEGQPGTGLTPADFVAGRLNYENPRALQDVLPDQRRLGATVAVHQDLGGLKLTADARYGVRRAKARIRAQTATLTVSRANPYFVSPNGSASHQIAYAFGDDLGAPVARSTQETVTAALGARGRLFGDWQADGYLGFAQEITENGTDGMLNTALLQEALGNTPDRPETAYSPGRDGYFNPFSGLPNQAPAVLAAIGQGFSATRGVSRAYTANLQADGALVRLPAGALKLALGAQARRETFDHHGSVFTSTLAPRPTEGTDAARTVAAGFAELRAPLFGPDHRRPGLERLEVSAAVRVERYSDFGTTTNPKVGLAWTPVDGLNLRATFGRSFRAPGLRDLRSSQGYTAGQLPLGTGRTLILLLQGGNPDLKPETATTYTVGFDLRPAAAPGLRLSGTWFETRFEDRIDQPTLQNLQGVLSDPVMAPFVRRIRPDLDPADLALITAYLNHPASEAGGLFPPQDYRAIVDARLVNTGRVTVRGVDLEAAYARPLAGGDLTLSASATRLLDYKQRVTPASPDLERSGVAGFPADLQARLAADWSRGGAAFGVSLNHTGDLRTAAGGRVDDLTTVDARVRLTGRDDSAFEGVSLTLNVRNLFAAGPPFYDNRDGYAFDPANADVVGRVVSLELARRW